MHWIDPLISFFPVCPSVCLSVCVSVNRWFSNDYVHSSLPISRNFVCGSEMRSFRRLLFVRQTGSSLPILEVCGFRFRQFSGSFAHIFQQISTKSHIQIKFSNTKVSGAGRQFSITAELSDRHFSSIDELAGYGRV